MGFWGLGLFCIKTPRLPGKLGKIGVEGRAHSILGGAGLPRIWGWVAMNGPAILIVSYFIICILYFIGG